MEIRAAMLEYALERRGRKAELKGNGEMAVARIRDYHEGGRESGTLYVAKVDETYRKPPSSAGYAIMQVDGDAAIAYDAMRELDLWDSQLKDALLEGASLEEFVRLGQDMLDCPIAYFDRNLIALAATDDFWSIGTRPGEAAAAIQVDGQMPVNRAIDLIEDVDYSRAAGTQGGFYYESSQNLMYYGINTFDQEEYLARLVLALPEGQDWLHRGQEQLVERFHELLDQLHLRYAGNAGVVSSQNDALHAIARRVLLGGDAMPVPRDEATAILASFDWGFEDDYMVAQLVFFEGLHWNTVSLYLCGLLERAMAGSCAFPTDQQIVWLVNLKRAARVGETKDQALQRFIESLVSVLRNYACKAGISDDFDSFATAHNAYKEAKFALEIGQMRDPHYWYFMFRAYALDYLLSKCIEDLEPSQVCHPALEVLLAYDAEHETEYARTLVCFLRNSQNTTHAADELYIHRTSFMRRMAHITELTNLDLTDTDQVLHLLLSAKLLGMQ